MRSRALESDPRLGDALVELYVDWREECSAVRFTYQRWREASKEDREDAFAAYNAALDREERASEIYAALIRRVTPGAPRPG